jgi:Spy/CpxP family protein refolding chaperone
MKRPTVSIILYLCLVFVSGLLVGAFGFSLYSKRVADQRPNPQRMQSRYLEEMRTGLKLGDDQVQKLKVIMEAAGKRFHALREKNRPEEREIHDQYVQSVRAILNDAQRAEYDKMREEREKRHQQEGRRGPGR